MSYSILTRTSNPPPPQLQQRAQPTRLRDRQCGTIPTHNPSVRTGDFQLAQCSPSGNAAPHPPPHESASDAISEVRMQPTRSRLSHAKASSGVRVCRGINSEAVRPLGHAREGQPNRQEGQPDTFAAGAGYPLTLVV
jgi:hypothetical protein